MLSLRLAVFAALAGLALWALFSLLDTLREPQLLRSAKAVIVKGCEPVESPAAMQRCPQLLCQKHLLERKIVPWRSSFEITVDARSGNERLIGGVTGGADGQTFACVLTRNRVSAADLLDPGDLAVLAQQSGAWAL